MIVSVLMKAAWRRRDDAFMKVIVGVGVPGSGKTTYLRPVADQEGLLYLNADDIRNELTGDASNHTKEGQVWDLLHYRLVESLKSGRGVVVDATYANVRNRKGLIKIVRSNGAREVVAIWFNVSTEVSLVRNSKRERKVPEDVIIRMSRSLISDPPDIQEGFDAVVEILE